MFMQHLSPPDRSRSSLPTRHSVLRGCRWFASVALLGVIAHAVPATTAHAQEESPTMGVIVGSCPGDAVCVLDTILGSPADESGIRQGDYIISVDGKKVTTPQELRQAVSEQQGGEQVKVTVWRDGEEMEKEITLAARSEEPLGSHKAWLGVLLSPAEEQGLVVEQVLRNSPADEAGLRSGDTILESGDSKVRDVESFMESIEDKGPGSEMELTVLRDDEKRTVTVTLGAVEEAPMQFFRESMGSMDRALRDRVRQRFGRPNWGDDSPFMDQTIDEMRRRIRQLEQQVEQLQGPQQQGRDQRREPQRRQDEGDEVRSKQPPSGIAGAELSETTLVVQRGFRRRENSLRRLPGDRDFGDWRRWYRREYRAPLYESPRYGNQYFRRGGSPYFYNNYGPGIYNYRNGFGVGNFGSFWY